MKVKHFQEMGNTFLLRVYRNTSDTMQLKCQLHTRKHHLWMRLVWPEGGDRGMLFDKPLYICHILD